MKLKDFEKKETYDEDVIEYKHKDNCGEYKIYYDDLNKELIFHGFYSIPLSLIKEVIEDIESEEIS